MSRLLLAGTSRAAVPVRRGSTLAGRFDVAIIGGGHNGLVAVSSAVCAYRERVACFAPCCRLRTCRRQGRGWWYWRGGTSWEERPSRRKSSPVGGEKCRVMYLQCTTLATYKLIAVCSGSSPLVQQTHVSVVAQTWRGFTVFPLHCRCRIPLLSCLLRPQPLAASSDPGPAAEGGATV